MRSTVLLIGAMLWSSIALAATGTESMARELDIMREILRTVSNSKKSNSVKVSRVTAHYLEGQGALFPAYRELMTAQEKHRDAKKERARLRRERQQALAHDRGRDR